MSITLARNDVAAKRRAAFYACRCGEAASPACVSADWNIQLGSVNKVLHPGLNEGIKVRLIQGPGVK